MKTTSYFIIALLVFSCNRGQENISGSALLISNVDIIDVRSGTILKDRQVVVDSGKIQKISETLENPQRYTQEIDADGTYLMPGLAEMHAHIPPPSVDAQRIEDVLFLYLSNGITTIRGMLGDPSHLTLREKATQNAIQSPRIFTSSPSLNGNTVQTETEADTKIRRYQEEGYDFLKIHPGIKLEVFNQIVETANEVDIPFAGHVPVDVGIRRALKSQYASIDHIDGFLEGLVPESANVKPDENGFFGFNFTPLANPEKIDELVQLAKSNKVWIVPTQSLFERWFAPVPADELLNQPEMKYMPSATLEDWKERKNESTSADNGFSEQQWQRFDSIRMRLLKALQKGGHGMLLGSDAPQLFNVPGFSIHHEIDGMERSGLTPLEIIQSGTLNPAIFFDKEDEFGEIKEGLSADMILLQENPLDNLDALQDPLGVMVRGQWFPKEKIKQELARIALNAQGN